MDRVITLETSVPIVLHKDSHRMSTHPGTKPKRIIDIRSKDLNTVLDYLNSISSDVDAILNKTVEINEYNRCDAGYDVESSANHIASTVTSSIDLIRSMQK